MKLLGTTGTRKATKYHDTLVSFLHSPTFDEYTKLFDGFVSGGCKGWDAIFGETLARLYPDKRHIVIVPANRSQVDPWWEQPDFEHVWVDEMPAGSSYRDRNTKIVEMSAELFYVANGLEDEPSEKRSGTWMTVRIARNKGLEPWGFVLPIRERAS